MKKPGKITITESHAEPEPEAAGARSLAGSPPKAPPGTTRYGASGAASGHRERGLVPGTGLLGRLGQFIRDVRAEMKRVSWPGANEVKNTTIITLVAVIFFALYLFVVDRIWAFLLTQLNHLLNWLTGAA